MMVSMSKAYSILERELAEARAALKEEKAFAEEMRTNSNQWAEDCMQARAEVERLGNTKIGPDWREALPYETEIELVGVITRLRAEVEQLKVELEKYHDLASWEDQPPVVEKEKA